MRVIRRIKRLFWLSVLCFTVMSVTFLIMPVASSITTSSERQFPFLVGTIFWISAVTGYVLVVTANSKRRWFLIHRTDAKVNMNCHCGFLTFFSNTIATVFDSILITSIVVAVITVFTDWKNTFLPYILLFLITLSLNLHSMFNGRIYKVTKYKRVRRGTDNE